MAFQWINLFGVPVDIIKIHDLELSVLFQKVF